MTPRTRNRATYMCAAVAISLAALFQGTQSFADTNPANANAADAKAVRPQAGPVLPAPVPLPAPASQSAAAPVTLAPATPEFFTPPKRSSAPGSVSASDPRSGSDSGAGSGSDSRSGSGSRSGSRSGS